MFNVQTKDGRHIGIIAGSFKSVLLVAVTEEKFEDAWLNLPRLEQVLAEVLGCKGLMGINQTRLERELKHIWANSCGGLYSQHERTLALKTAFLERLRDISCLHPDACTPGDSGILAQVPGIAGYVLMYREGLQWLNRETVLLDAALDYIDLDLEILGTPAVFGKILDYPVIETWAGSGLEAATAIYVTHLTIQSGNVNQEVSFSVPLHCRRGDTILLYPKGSAIASLVVDGRVYNFPDHH